MGKKRAELVPREFLLRGGFTTLHMQSFAAATWFYELLESAVADVRARAAAIGGEDEMLAYIAAGGALERQGLSEAVQAFCAMTVEAATNLLGVLTLGEKQFMATIEREPVVEKLKTLYRLIRGESLPPNDILLTTAKALCEARNQFVHPKPQEGGWRSDPTRRRSDLEGARLAMSETRDFLRRIQGVEPKFAPFLSTIGRPPNER